MKRTGTIIVVVVVILLLAAGGYAVFHKSNKPATTNASSTKTSKTQSNLPSVNNAVVITKTDSKLGKYLADPSGNTLYTYGGDSSGVSNCSGGCLANWPAYQDKGATTGLPSDISTIKRTDNGETQFTYNGMPLYYFNSDTKGMVTGNGVANFKVAKPVASSSSTSTSNSSSSTNNPY